MRTVLSGFAAVLVGLISSYLAVTIGPIPTVRAQQACLAGDINKDGKISLTDFELWRRVFRESGGPSIAPTNPPSSSGWVVSKLYVDPNSQPAMQAKQWETSNPAGAAIMRKVAAVSQGLWHADPNPATVQSAVNSQVSAAAAAGAMPILVAYAIPFRDCGNFAGGGAASRAAYETWINNFASGIGNNPAVVILEPDALLLLDNCLDAAGQQDRMDMLKYAVGALKAKPKTYVYIDAGVPRWRSPDQIAGWLTKSGIAQADGFSLNVSNFFTTSEVVDYGTQISSKVGGKHFVIDTSRNGNGPTADFQWCNPPGRALGAISSTSPGLGPLVDAILWIKTPGTADGPCNGGPGAGAWWPEYLVQLAQNAGW